jgi:hypothetical protein
MILNSSYTVAPWAEMLVFVDVRWWEVHAVHLKDFAGKIVTTSREALGDHLLRVRRRDPKTVPFSDNPAAVSYERTVLHAALNIAAHRKPKRIVLIGIDMQRGANGVTHHHPPHKWRNKNGNLSWDLQMEQLKLVVEPLAKLGIEVLNASPNSRLPWWPKVKLEDVIDGNVGQPGTRQTEGAQVQAVLQGPPADVPAADCRTEGAGQAGKHP